MLTSFKLLEIIEQFRTSFFDGVGEHVVGRRKTDRFKHINS